jgi:hypothetical protein
VEEANAVGKAMINALCYFDCNDRCRDAKIDERPERLFSILEMLVATGADVIFRDDDSRQHPSPFWAAVHPPMIPPSIVHFLLAHGLRVNEHAPYYGLPIFAVSERGRTRAAVSVSNSQYYGP